MRVLNSSSKDIPLPNGCIAKTGGSARLAKLTPAVKRLILSGELEALDFTVTVDTVIEGEEEVFESEADLSDMPELRRKRVIMKKMIDSGQIVSPILCTNYPQEK